MGPGYHMSKQNLMRITVVAEHYVGVNNGGMDQAASVCGEEDHALYVEFKPQLKATRLNFRN
ncbi:ANL_collapsed_G0002070.mRNA.1.CDS.1 [Saccharomyces cerevisiae]|nr:ANL_collapsed_G0002070.mRNA.1.CDS.1 [Saccharomyces cerevisiae]